MFTFHKDDVSVFFFFSMMHVLVSYLKFMIILNILQFIHPLSFKKWKILTKKKKKKKWKIIIDWKVYGHEMRQGWAEWYWSWTNRPMPIKPYCLCHQPIEPRPAIGWRIPLWRQCDATIGTATPNWVGYRTDRYDDILLRFVGVFMFCVLFKK